MKKISNFKYGLVLLLIAFTVASIITLVSCTSGVDGGENKWVLISFKIEWPQGFDFNCGSGEQVSVRIIALDQDGTEFNWSGSISINSTNANIAVLPSIADIENGSANVTLMFENLSSENQETQLVLNYEDADILLADLLLVNCILNPSVPRWGRWT
jgi:hypothetical protein